MQHQSEAQDPEEVKGHQQGDLVLSFGKVFVHKVYWRGLHPWEEGMYLPRSWRLRALDPSHDIIPCALYPRGYVFTSGVWPLGRVVLFIGSFGIRDHYSRFVGRYAHVLIVAIELRRRGLITVVILRAHVYERAKLVAGGRGRQFEECGSSASV
jgi:hypothetical protein